MKISIIGASGDVGQEVFKRVIHNNIADCIVLFYHTLLGKHKLIGMLSDELIGIAEKNVIISDNPESISDSKIIILCAGKAVSRDVDSIPVSGILNKNNRNSLYEENQKLILNYIEGIKSYASESLIILVTNPVTKLLHDIAAIYPELLIVGCGVTNDTLRLRNEVRINYPTIQVDNLFVIGEHDLNTQCVALSYFNKHSNFSFTRDLFEYEFSSEEEKRKRISELKNKQNADIATNNIRIDNYDNLPLLYRSYFKHRMAHFLYKTHISTASAVMEIIEAFISESRTVCSEISVKECVFGQSCVIGLPIRFVEGNIVIEYSDFDRYEQEILRLCTIDKEVIS